MDLLDCLIRNAEESQEKREVFEIDISPKVNFALHLLEQIRVCDLKYKKYLIDIQGANARNIDNILYQLKEEINILERLENPLKQIKFIFAQKSMI